MLFNSFLYIYLFFRFIFKIVLIINKSQSRRKTFLNDLNILNFIFLLNICLSYKRRGCQLKIIVNNRDFSWQNLLVFTIALIIMIKSSSRIIILKTFLLILLNKNYFAIHWNFIQRKELLSIKIRKHFGEYFLASGSQIAKLLKNFIKRQILEPYLLLYHWVFMK